MLKSLFITVYISTSCLISWGQSPKSDFSHIEIIIDSTDFTSIVKNEFIRQTLGSCTYDTLQKSPLVISYYINGLESFIHFNPNRGLFASQLGTAYLIFQSRLPGQGRELKKQWRSVTNDSLKSYDFKGPDFLLTEIILKEHWNIAKSKGHHLIPMLSSYSVATYKNWGLGDSTEVSMKKFIGGDSTKVFNKLLYIKLSITQKELNSLTPILRAIGYELRGRSFSKQGQPEISFVINSKGNGFKVKEFGIQLNRTLAPKILKFGAVTVNINKDNGKFIFD